jgi:hypothetical protein
MISMEFDGLCFDSINLRVCRFLVWAFAVNFPLLISNYAIAQQQTVLTQPVTDSLPDAPQPQHIDRVPNDQISGKLQESVSSVKGIVQDSTGAAILGAQVSISPQDGERLQTVQTGALGVFAFNGLAAGSYVVTVEADGFAPFKTREFPLAAQELHSLPLTLSVAEATMWPPCPRHGGSVGTVCSDSEMSRIPHRTFFARKYAFSTYRLLTRLLR